MTQVHLLSLSNTMTLGEYPETKTGLKAQEGAPY